MFCLPSENGFLLFCCFPVAPIVQLRPWNEVRERQHSLRTNGLFLSAFPSLSRVCLGKMFVYIFKKWRPF